MEKAGMPVYSKNDPQLIFVQLSNENVQGIRDMDALQIPLENQSVITLRQLIRKLLPQNEQFTEHDLRPFVSRVQVYARTNQSYPLAFCISYQFQVQISKDDWYPYSFEGKYWASKLTGYQSRGFKCLYITKQLLFVWKYAIDQPEEKQGILKEIENLFKCSSIFESVKVPKNRGWSLLIYSYDHIKDKNRPYPAQSDYSATCRVFKNEKGFTIICHKKLKLYGPLSSEYDVLANTQQNVKLQNLYQNIWLQIQQEYQQRSSKNKHIIWSRPIEKLIERPIPLADMKVYNIGCSNFEQIQKKTEKEARLIAFGEEGKPDMVNGKRQVQESFRITNELKKQGRLPQWEIEKIQYQKLKLQREAENESEEEIDEILIDIDLNDKEAIKIATTNEDIKRLNFFDPYLIDQLKDAIQREDLKYNNALDVGCGYGRVTKHILVNLFDYINLYDNNENVLAQAKKLLIRNRQKCTFKSANMQTFYSSIKYNCIVFRYCLGFLKYDLAVNVLKNHAKLLSKDNSAIFVQDQTIPDTDHEDIERCQRMRCKQLFRDIFRQANLAIVDESEEVTLPKYNDKEYNPVTVWTLKPV